MNLANLDRTIEKLAENSLGNFLFIGCNADPEKDSMTGILDCFLNENEGWKLDLIHFDYMSDGSVKVTGKWRRYVV